MPSSVHRLAETIAEELAEDGAEAVVLVGSHTNGTASPSSDLDLAVVGEGPPNRLEVRDGTLVSIGRAPADVQRARLYEPDWLATHVPGWRSAVLLHDPHGVAAELQNLARSWAWALVEADCNAWVVGWIVGLSEEVQKLATAVASGDRALAAVQRFVVAVRLVRVVAVHRRILYGSENALWRDVPTQLGPEWERGFASALGIEPDDDDAAVAGAMRLFELAAAEVSALLDQRQRDVIDHALQQGAATGARPARP